MRSSCIITTTLSMVVLLTTTSHTHTASALRTPAGRTARRMLEMAYVLGDGPPGGVGGGSSSNEAKLPIELRVLQDKNSNNKNNKNLVVANFTEPTQAQQDVHRGAGGTLGDIMSDETATTGLFALATQDGGTLASRFGIENRLDRMAVTANGNLQRLFSSYYDAHVHVVVDKCEQQSSTVWDRVVHLTVLDQVFCSAHSTVTIHDKKCRDLVKSGEVGLGQLFRYMDRLPTFQLLDAGYADDNGALWRIYELKCQELSCRIREEFSPQAWEIE